MTDWSVYGESNRGQNVDIHDRPHHAVVLGLTGRQATQIVEAHNTDLARSHADDGQAVERMRVPNIEHESADQIRRMLADDERFPGVSGATAFRQADPKQGWQAAGFFSFERDGKFYFVTVELAGG